MTKLKFLFLASLLCFAAFALSCNKGGTSTDGKKQPTIAVIPISFSSTSFLSYPLPGFSLQWYEKVLAPRPWLPALRNSLIVGTGATVIATVLGTLAALGLARNTLPWRSFLLGLIISPTIVPVVISGVVANGDPKAKDVKQLVCQVHVPPGAAGGIGGIVLISGEVWIHHLYVSGMPDWLRIGQMVSTLLISVPVGLLVISLVGTLYKGAISFETPMLYALGVVFLFLIGGLTGIPLAITSLTVNLSETYYVVGHFHYVMAVAGTFAIFGGVYYWFPKMSGRMYNELWGKIGFWITFVGVNIVFWTMMDIGARIGLPRRYYDYAQFPQAADAQHLMTIGAVILGVGFVIALLNWIIGAAKGPAQLLIFER